MTQRSFRLTQRAERSLGAIVDWTIEKFGVRQAARYRDELIDQCLAICSGHAQSMDCSRLIGGNAGINLQMTRAGEHFIVHMVDGSQIVILDFIHSKMNLPERIARLKP